MMAPTLAPACGSLPPEGAVLAWGGPALRTLAPTLVATPLFENTAYASLPPEGAIFPRGGPSEKCLALSLVSVVSGVVLPLHHDEGAQPSGSLRAWRDGS